LFGGFEISLSAEQYLPGLVPPDPCPSCPDLKLSHVPKNIFEGIIAPKDFDVLYSNPNPEPAFWDVGFRYVGNSPVDGPTTLKVALLSPQVISPDIAALQFVGNGYSKQTGKQLQNVGDVKFFNSIGDFNGDRYLDVMDVNLISEVVRSGEQKELFDLNHDNRVDADDVSVWAENLRLTYVGDANLDGQFDSTDLVQIFQAGLYETENVLASWSTGDWTSDGKFNSTDLIAAFQSGGYDQGPIVVVATVPEPMASWLFGTGVLSLILRRRGFASPAV
jgi:hypothetical protein